MADVGTAERICTCTATFDTDTVVRDDCGSGELECARYVGAGDQITFNNRRACETTFYDDGATDVVCDCAPWQEMGGCAPCDTTD